MGGGGGFQTRLFQKMPTEICDQKCNKNGAFNLLEGVSQIERFCHVIK